MKTVAVSVRGVDESFRYSGDAPAREIGRFHAEAVISYVLGLPRSLPEGAEADPEKVPAVRLDGRHGAWLDLRRRVSGSDLFLSAKDGETDIRIPEVQAAYRVRDFVEHWGEDTELTAEIRLPPEVREAIADQERIEDDTRRRRMREAPPRDVFSHRPWSGTALLVLAISIGWALAYAAGLIFLPGLPAGAQIGGAAVLLAGLVAAPWLFFRKHELVVDREKGEVREHRLGKERLLTPLSEIRHTDVLGLSRADAKECGVVLVLADDTEIEVGPRGWPPRRALQIAESVNDSIDLPAAKRKMLRYRRALRAGDQDPTWTSRPPA